MTRCLHVWPIGLADADDGENWGGIQSSLSGPLVQRLKFNYQMGSLMKARTAAVQRRSIPT